MKRGKLDYKSQSELLMALLKNFNKEMQPSGSGTSEKSGNEFYRKQKKSVNEIARRLKIQNKKLLEQLQFLKTEVKKYKADKNELTVKFNQLAKLNRSLSDAVGSCHQCWGDDPACEVCGGNGSSGWRNINKRLFNNYIFPAVEKKYESEQLVKNSKRTR
ncbi:MAG TPA: hypothetical protein VKT28_02000 [Puia sp.]|nr:hypothetical protein [Puia sp.]